ncbi:helix-turn-helix domain-containing protein [Halomarina halobia]|uniref:Helix-turn-helix domain-containing protein n=1 Tax=Halomarina halobia TaxID=3033386 RepID=A0ABD6A5J3_9EURY|nr:helix-turn-helix domain-containing protein [Halomarina sp. PSR21]
MVVIAEISLSPSHFPLGAILRDTRDVRVEFERIVPLRKGPLPLFWAKNGDLEAFESRVVESEYVDELTVLERLDNRVLYSVQWNEPKLGFLDGLAATDAVILQAHTQSDENWDFRLLFPSHERLSEFHNICLDGEVSYSLGRIYSLNDPILERDIVDVTPEQRKALLLALHRGYFDTPSQTTLTDLANELDISQQALSQRIRRGNRAILERVLDTSSGDPPIEH